MTTPIVGQTVFVTLPKYARGCYKEGQDYAEFVVTKVGRKYIYCAHNPDAPHYVHRKFEEDAYWKGRRYIEAGEYCESVMYPTLDCLQEVKTRESCISEITLVHSWHVRKFSTADLVTIRDIFLKYKAIS